MILNFRVQLTYKDTHRSFFVSTPCFQTNTTKSSLFHIECNTSMPLHACNVHICSLFSCTNLAHNKAYVRTRYRVYWNGFISIIKSKNRLALQCSMLAYNTPPQENLGPFSGLPNIVWHQDLWLTLHLVLVNNLNARYRHEWSSSRAQRFKVFGGIQNTQMRTTPK